MEDPKEKTGEEDKKAIMARRDFLIRAALTSAGVGTALAGCGRKPAVCLTVKPPDSPPREPHPQECLDVAPPDDAPNVCLDVAPPDDTPNVCLEVMPPEENPEPCLDVIELPEKHQPIPEKCLSILPEARPCLKIVPHKERPMPCLSIIRKEDPQVCLSLEVHEDGE